MADEFEINLGLKTETLTSALRQINEAISKPMDAGDQQKIQGLNRIITNLMNQQNIYLRAAERSGRVHATRMAEYDRYFEGVASNLRLRASLRDDSGSGGGTPISNMLSGGTSPGGTFKKVEGKMSEMFDGIYDYATAQQKKGKAQGGAVYPNMSGSTMKNSVKSLGRFGAAMNNKMGSFIKKGGDFFNSTAGKGVMAGGMATAGIFSMIIKKAIEASPMLQQMLKIVNMAVMLWLRPIGDFFGFMFKPIAMYLLRASINSMKNITEMQKMGSEFGRKILAFFLNPGAVIQAAIWGGGNEGFMKQVDAIISSAYDKLGGDWSKQMTRYQAKVANVSGGYSMEIPTQLTGLLVGMEAKYGQYSLEIESWLKQAVPIFEEFAIVVPEEMIGAWNYYMNEVDNGTMKMSQVMSAMNIGISMFVTQGTGAMAGIVQYTNEYKESMGLIEGVFSETSDQLDSFAGQFTIEFGTTTKGMNTTLAADADIFNAEFAAVLGHTTDVMSATSDNADRTVLEAENTWGSLAASLIRLPGEVAQSINSILGINMTAGTTVGGGNAVITGNNMGGSLSEYIIRNAMDTKVATSGTVVEATDAIAKFLAPLSNEAVKMATEYLQNTDLSKYFGDRATGGIGASFGTGPQYQSGLMLTDIAKKLGIMGGDTEATAEMQKTASDIIDNFMKKSIQTLHESDQTPQLAEAIAEQQMFKVMNAIHGAALAQPDTISDQLTAMSQAMSNPEGSDYAHYLGVYNQLQSQYPGMSIASGLMAQAQATGTSASSVFTGSVNQVTAPSGNGGGNGGGGGNGPSGNSPSSGGFGGNRGPGGNTGPSGGGGGAPSGGGATTNSGGGKNSTGRQRRQLGGWITEPIFGIGQNSGTGYSFGEGGVKEFVTPSHSMDGSDGGGINIIFNIDKIEKDVDLEEIQRRIERAILEVHSRRGIV